MTDGPDGVTLGWKRAVVIIAGLILAAVGVALGLTFSDPTATTTTTTTTVVPIDHGTSLLTPVQGALAWCLNRKLLSHLRFELRLSFGSAPGGAAPLGLRVRSSL